MRNQGWMDQLIGEQLVVENERSQEVPSGEWAALIESRKLPFVSYPYEWSFSMLQDAAVLTLKLTERAMDQGMILKDASAYNVMFDGAKPTFIDITSFSDYEEGMPWVAYGQFCDHFLSPLMLQAYKGVSFQPFLRSDLEGISTPHLLAPLLSFRDLFRPGVLSHVKLRSMVEGKAQSMNVEERRATRQIPFSRGMVLRNIRKLQKLVSSLKLKSRSSWTDYEEENTYDDSMRDRKMRFVQDVGQKLQKRGIAWDVGSNLGRHAETLSHAFNLVVAMDQDPHVVDRLYRKFRGNKNIHPLVIDAMNPSPAQGWRGAERESLLQRGKPDLALFLALIHHICIGQNVTISEFLEMVRETSSSSIVEFVALDDPMAQKLLATRSSFHSAYSLDLFRSEVKKMGRIVQEEELSSSRTLFHLEMD